MTTSKESNLFPAVLKYWRHKRGMSQLTLALSADVSSRHISFLETGRSKPSEEMVLRLASTLNVPLSEQNAVMRSAGFHSASRDDLSSVLDHPHIATALTQMKKQHEPYPLVVLNSVYDLVDANVGSAVLLHFLMPNVTLSPPMNLLEATFDPKALRPFIKDWPVVAHDLVTRLHREVLHFGEDERRGALLDRILALPDVPNEWRHPKLSGQSEPVITFDISKGDTHLSFLTTVTRFSAPQNVAVDDLLIESYFPADDDTAAWCQDRSA